MSCLRVFRPVRTACVIVLEGCVDETPPQQSNVSRCDRAKMARVLHPGGDMISRKRM
jgi:hypothetical protein